METPNLSRRQMLSRLGLTALIGAEIPATAGAAAANPAITPIEPINVLAHGAAADGARDDTAAFNAALKAAAAAGNPTVFVPAGRYMIKGNLDIPSHVTLQGVFKAPAERSEGYGSVLLAVAGAGKAEGDPFLMMHTSSTLRGITVFYPNQKMENPPIAYPWTVAGEGDDICLIDNLLVNPYQAVDFGSRPCGRHFINGLFAQPLYRGIFVDKCFDIGRIENVHFWSFWGGWDGDLYAFMRSQAVAFLIARTDWEFIDKCFCIGYRIGYHFIQNESGPGNCILTQSGSDISPNSVRVDASQAHAGHTFVNCQFMAGIETGKTNLGPLKFTACGFWGVPTTDYHALLEGQGHTFFNSCHFITWAQRDHHAPCIHAKRGGLTVTACDFMDANKAQILIEEDVDAAMVYGNRLRGAQGIINKAPAGRSQIAMNVVSAK